MGRHELPAEVRIRVRQQRHGLRDACAARAWVALPKHPGSRPFYINRERIVCLSQAWPVNAALPYQWILPRIRRRADLSRRILNSRDPTLSTTAPPRAPLSCVITLRLARILS